MSISRVELLWIPLGSGGPPVVRWSGRLWRWTAGVELAPPSADSPVNVGPTALSAPFRTS